MAESLMEFHPASRIFPLMEGDDFEQLKADIAAHGLHNAIVTLSGMILDGRNRYRACRAVGVRPKFVAWNNGQSAADFVWSENFHRRHLSTGARAACAVEHEKLKATEAKARQRAAASKGGKRSGRTRRGEVKVVARMPQPSPPAKSRDEAARAANISPRYVQDAKLVAKHSPALLEQVKTEQLTLPQAKRQVLNEQKRSELKAKADTVTAKAESLPWRIVCGDCVEELAKLKPASARLIFADPPYNIGRDYHGQGAKADSHPDQQYLAWCERWMRECARVLSDDGSLWVMISDDYADDFGVILRRMIGLNRRAWIKWYETFGVNRPNNFNRTSRHIFYMTKDAKRFVFHESAVNRKSDRQLKYGDKRADPAGKTLDDVWGIEPIDPLPRLCGTAAEKIPGFDNQLPIALVSRIIRCASDPGDVVLDPFNGTGTSGVAAIQTGRAYIGIEKNGKAVDVSKDRMKVEFANRRPA